MRIHITKNGLPLSAGLLERITAGLEELNTPHEDIFEARVTLVRPDGCQPRGVAIFRVELMLAGMTLQVARDGETQEDAMQAVLHATDRQLQSYRSLREAGMSL
jgi:hypothetical protein